MSSKILNIITFIFILKASFIHAETMSGTSQSFDKIKAIEQYITPTIQIQILPKIVQDPYYPMAIQYLFQNLMSWHPSELKPNKISQKCVQLQTNQRQDFINQCEKDLITQHTSDSYNAIKMLSMKMTETEFNQFHRIQFQINGKKNHQVYLNARLALQNKPAPLIVFRNGVFSSVDSFLAERTYAYLFFFKLGYHLLIIENTTSPQFISNNSFLSFGGIDESLQNILIGKYFADEKNPIHNLIQSLHLAGISLGGQGVLYASQLNDLNHHIYQNVTALCPVVHLKSNLETFFYPHNLSNYFKNYWARKRLTPIFHRLGDFKISTTENTIQDVFTHIAKNYQGPILLNENIKVPHYFYDKKYIWDLLESWNEYKDVKTPVTIIATKNDDLVGYQINGGTLIDQKNTEHILFNYGNHCSLPIAYQWDFLTDLFQQLFSKK